MIWIPVTIGASFFQVARNAYQRGMMARTGPWGATLVRFLFGLPFSLLFAGAWLMTPAADFQFTPTFWAGEIAGALSQVLATAALLVSMRRAGFAVGTAVQQSSLPFAAILGWVTLGDALSPAAWAGVAICTAGLFALSWPRTATGEKPVSGALFGLLSGAFFAVSLVGFRTAGLSLEPEHPVVSAFGAVVVAQAMQSVGLILYLLLRDRPALVAVFTGWRQSLGAGLFGALASAGWFLAVTLAPAAAVRAVGVVESPIAAAAGRRLFAERLHPGQIVAGVAVLIGVLMTALT
jgi:drug/metabolite transporter (DMT)-like permease